MSSVIVNWHRPLERNSQCLVRHSSGSCEATFTSDYHGDSPCQSRVFCSLLDICARHTRTDRIAVLRNVIGHFLIATCFHDNCERCPRRWSKQSQYLLILMQLLVHRSQRDALCPGRTWGNICDLGTTKIQSKVEDMSPNHETPFDVEQCQQSD